MGYPLVLVVVVDSDCSLVALSDQRLIGLSQAGEAAAASTC